MEISYETPEPHPVHDWSALYLGMATTRIHGGVKGWEALKARRICQAEWGFFAHNLIILTKMTREEALANVKKAPKLLRRNYHGKLTGKDAAARTISPTT